MGRATVQIARQPTDRPHGAAADAGRTESAPLVSALHTVTVAVPDVEEAAELLGALCGHVTIARGELTGAERRCWGVDLDGGYTVTGAPGSGRGYLRLIGGSPRPARKKLARRWVGVEIVVADVDAVVARIRHSGLTIVGGPATVDLTDAGSNRHRAVAVAMPGGWYAMFTTALTEPVGRRFTPTTGSTGPVFAAHLRASRGDHAIAPYRDVLGMSTFLDVGGRYGFLHRFWSLPPGTPVRLRLLRGGNVATGLGSIELHEHAARSLDPTPVPRDTLDGGVVLVTYTSKDADAAYRALVAVGVPTVAPPRPLGDGRPGFVFHGAAGERVEVVGGG